MMMMVALIDAILIIVLVFVNRIERNWLKHTVMLLARRMAKRRPGDVGKR